VQQYLKVGARLVWIVVPEDRSVSVHRSGQEAEIFTESDTLSGTDVLPSFQCAVSDLFP
jgi:Uma2 family endonuclease